MWNPTQNILMANRHLWTDSVGRKRTVNPDLPPNLYPRGRRFVFRDPRTLREHPLGRDREAAIAEAIKANAYLRGEARNVLKALESRPERTFGALFDSYIAEVTPKASKRTIYNLRTLRRAIKDAEDTYIGPTAEDATVVTAKLREIQKSYLSQGKARMAQSFGSAMIQVFRHAAGMGWTSINPARELPRITVEVKRSRLTWDDFQKIYAEAQKMEPWVAISMELALVTLQRLGDISRMRRDHIKDGFLHVEQEKTGAKIRIPLGLRLNVLGRSLGEITISRRPREALGLGQSLLVASAFLVHHRIHAGRAKPSHPVHAQTISRAFAAARKAVGIKTEAGRKPATFHELRSLGIRLYQAQGMDPQVLAGHKDASTTAVYKDDRGAEWKEVSIK